MFVKGIEVNRCCRCCLSMIPNQISYLNSVLIVLLISKCIYATTSSICARVPDGHYVRSSQSCNSYNRCLNGQVRQITLFPFSKQSFVKIAFSSQCMECVRGDFHSIHWIKHAAIILMSIVGGARLMEFKIFRIQTIVQCTIAVTMVTFGSEI